MTSSKILSGGDRRFIELSKRWVLSGKSVHIMLPQVGFKQCTRKELKTAYIITSSSRIDRLGVILSYLFRMVKGVLWRPYENYSVVYSSSDLLCDTLPAALLKVKIHAKWIAIIHHIIPSPLGRSTDRSFFTNFLSFLAQRFSFKIIKRYADLILTVSKFTKQHLNKLSFPKHEIHVVDNGVDFRSIKKIRVHNVVYDACFLSRLHPTKGVFDLIQIWKRIVKEKRNAQLAVIGGGPKKIKDALENMIKRNRLQKNIHMLGFLPDGDAYRVMKSSKVFVFPSHEEGWGVAICEAMACGLPVIAYDLPVYREVFKQGLVTAPINDVKVFSEMVVELLENDERRRELSEKAMAQARKYDWDEVAMQELSLIEKMCAN